MPECQCVAVAAFFSPRYSLPYRELLFRLLYCRCDRYNGKHLIYEFSKLMGVQDKEAVAAIWQT